jgi:GNAT superfamily N-acetyltransferase
LRLLRRKTSSEFYEPRRTSIRDGVALIAFILGWFASAPFAWPFIKDGFDTGNPTVGVFRFAVVVFGAGLACGIIGMGIGAVAGWCWEALHRRRRMHHAGPADASTVSGSVAGGITAPGSSARPAQAAAARDTKIADSLRYGTDVSAAEYIELMRRSSISVNADEARTASALGKSANIGAWYNDRLVGVARVLSDGYLVALLADVVVDPGFRRRGIGRALLVRAVDITPRGMITAAVDWTTAPFFDRIGAERGPTGFIIRWQAGARSGAGK